MVSLALMEQQLSSDRTIAVFRKLYGNDTMVIAQQQQRYLHLANLFHEQFPQHEEAACFSTPGRTEVGGNHTDHQRGQVLCAAVSLDILAFAAPNQENVIRLKSEGFKQMDQIDLDRLHPIETEREHSAALIRGIAAAFVQRGYRIGGLDIYTTSQVPKGSGLSSSAAFEVLVATILDVLFNQGTISPVERAIISQYAENVYFGKPSGLMDQCGCSVGGFITIDFALQDAPVVRPIDLHFEESGYGLVITHTGGSHADLTGDYASIPADMRQIAHYFSKSVLREVPEEDFIAALPQLREQVSDRALLRGIHFYEDNQRVEQQVDALSHRDFPRFLELVRRSGISSWTRLQNIWSVMAPLEQPLALALALSDRILGNRGATRVHGGGFAGTIQAFVPLDMMQDYLNEMGRFFGKDSVVELTIRNCSSCEVDLS